MALLALRVTSLTGGEGRKGRRRQDRAWHAVPRSRDATHAQHWGVGKAVREVRPLPAWPLAASQTLIVLRSQTGRGELGRQGLQAPEQSCLHRRKGRGSLVVTSDPVLTQGLNTGEVYHGKKRKDQRVLPTASRAAVCQQWSLCPTMSPFGGRTWRVDIHRVTWGPGLHQL